MNFFNFVQKNRLFEKILWRTKVSNSQIPQIPKEKKVISNRRFFSTKSKKIQKKEKKSKIQKVQKKVITKKIVENFGFFEFFKVFFK